MKDGPDGIQALLQSKYLFGKQVGSFHLCFLQCLPVINEMLNGKIILVLLISRNSSTSFSSCRMDS